MASSVSKISDIAAAYRHLNEADGEAVTERLERLILDHEPRSAEEAAVMLEFVGLNLEVGGRSDGRDRRALECVIAWLRDDA